ncbi:MAG TPA: DUF1572 family protein [Planctomycetaceae bacterium]|jgi:hypothetical protein|nr:DUF1572 family protein [Planctomycetaceae bacterium]
MLSEIRAEFRRYRKMAEEALADLDDKSFFHKPGTAVNPIALVVKHVGGNLRSRWTDFLTTDGEKPDRQRDTEFELAAGESRDAIMQRWDSGWSVLENTLGSLSNLDLDRTITIRGEAMSAREASLRSVTHTAYHVGQILYLARLLQPDRKWLTIPPGQSHKISQPYLDRTAEKKDRP